MHALINKLLFDWSVWRLRRKLLRISPDLREIDARERAARAGHRPVRSLMAERSRLLHAELARELGRHA